MDFCNGIWLMKSTASRSDIGNRGLDVSLKILTFIKVIIEKWTVYGKYNIR